MIVLHCPKCEQQTLIPTGGFWHCAACAFAITQAALLVESPVNNRQLSTLVFPQDSDAERASEHAL